MSKINPKISQDFLKEIKSLKEQILEIDGNKIKVCANVFPPTSQFSHSSEPLYKVFGDMKGKSVLDLGTGTGIQAIRAVKHGASRVVAVDINPVAVSCAKENVKLNKMEEVISVAHSDMFDSIAEERFDVIIANLPITDYPVEGVVESALYDPDWRLHKKLFKQGPDFLNPNGYIVLTHANFSGDEDFKKLEELLNSYNLVVDTYIEEVAIGYTWRMYRISVNKN